MLRSAAVAEDEGEPAAGLALEDRAGQRQHRGDAAAGGDRTIVVRGGGVGSDRELPHRRHDVEHVAGSQLGGGERREGTTGQPLDPDAELAGVGVGADRVAPSHVFSIDDRPHGDMLARQVAKGLTQLVWHVEHDRDGVPGLRRDLDHPQRMKDGRSHTLSSLHPAKPVASGG